MIMMPYGRCQSSLQLTGTQTSGTPQGEPGRAVAGLSGQLDSAHGASEASPAGEPFRLVEPQLV